jgi:hypothetical protein
MSGDETYLVTHSWIVYISYSIHASLFRVKPTCKIKYKSSVSHWSWWSNSITWREHGWCLESDKSLLKCHAGSTTMGSIIQLRRVETHISVFNAKRLERRVTSLPRGSVTPILKCTPIRRITNLMNVSSSSCWGGSNRYSLVLIQYIIGILKEITSLTDAHTEADKSG